MENYLLALQDLLNDPTSNLAATAIGLAVIALFAIILILILLIWAMSSQPTKRKPVRRGGVSSDATDAGRARAAGRPARRKRQPLSRATWAMIGIAIFGAIAATYGSTSLNNYCTGVCHSMSDATESNEGSAHASVPCVTCHEGTIVLSAPSATSSRLRSLYLEFAGSVGPGVPVPAARCLSCHEEIENGTVLGARAVLMSHTEVIAAGIDCTDCHGSQGHIGESLRVGMSSCIVCHDGTDVPADCTMCHPEGAEASILITKESFGQPVQLPERPTCGGCHPQDTCDECHGVRMPHPGNYSLGRVHARTAAFDGKDDICYRCHTTTDCYECHLNFNAHGANWDVRHRSADKDWCRSCHHPETENMCALCHD